MKNFKKRIKAGFTLVETLVSILILVIMVVATTTCMSTAIRIYRDATFLSNGSALESMLRSTMDDMLSYAQGVTGLLGAGDQDGDFQFTNMDYYAQDVYLRLNTQKQNGSPIQLISVASGEARDLLNTGAYPSLTIQKSDDTVPWVSYNEAEQYFSYRFTIVSQQDPSMQRKVEGVVYLLNP